MNASKDISRFDATSSSSCWHKTQRASGSVAGNVAFGYALCCEKARAACQSARHVSLPTPD
ncbi:MAG: hypothetical protein ACK58T_03770, partial [Phycisphaerae bacterium]